ncbi:hypothetical protein D3C85_1797550 [compost metagenome]
MMLAAQSRFSRSHTHCDMNGGAFFAIGARENDPLNLVRVLRQVRPHVVLGKK